MDIVLPTGVDASNFPVGTPPPGLTSNRVDPPSLSWAGRVSVYTTLPLMLAFLFLRFHVRLRSHQLGPDDFVCLIAAASITAFCVQALLLFLHDVYGRHSWDFPLSELTNYYVKYQLLTACLYDVACIFTKASLLILYLRIFRPLRRARILIWMGVIFVAVFYTICLAIRLGLCVPRGVSWVRTSVEPRCRQPMLQLNVAQGVINVLTDFYALAIPLALVLGLHLSMARKAGVLGIFLTGILACAFSVAGAVFRFQDANASIPDFNWLTVAVQAVCVAELNVGLICSCMPVVFVLFRGLAARYGSVRTSVRDWVKARSRQNHTSSVDGCPARAGYDTTEELPQVAKGSLSGLLSFMRGGASRSRWDSVVMEQVQSADTRVSC